MLQDAADVNADLGHHGRAQAVGRAIQQRGQAVPLDVFHDQIIIFLIRPGLKNLNNILNELVRSPLLAPAVFDLQGQPAPKPDADGRVQLLQGR